jgi:hypothetical protein
MMVEEDFKVYREFKAFVVVLVRKEFKVYRDLQAKLLLREFKEFKVRKEFVEQMVSVGVEVPRIFQIYVLLV